MHCLTLLLSLVYKCSNFCQHLHKIHAWVWQLNYSQTCLIGQHLGSEWVSEQILNGTSAECPLVHAFYFPSCLSALMFSVGGRKSTRPVKNEWWTYSQPQTWKCVWQFHKHVTFLENSLGEKLLKSTELWPSYSKNYRWTFFRHCALYYAWLSVWSEV